MAKYIYKINYNNSTFLAHMKRMVGINVTGSQCSSDSLMIIDADSSVKDDLDEYMNDIGFSYDGETLKTISSTKNWGILAASDLPDNDVNVGDHVYCSDTKKPLWWNGAAWVDATGN
jgi:hypothetical protein